MSAAAARRLATVTVVIDDYDRAKDYYCNVLGFHLIEDTVISAEKRWLVVAPGVDGARLLLARAKNDAEQATIGAQTGGRVGFFLETDDFEADYRRFKERGVDFVETPRQEAYGDVVVFRDLYGNLWDLIGRRTAG